MNKTDKDGILKAGDGVLINVKEDDYELRRARLIEERQQKDKINILENRVTSMENMLRQILEKVS